MIHHLTKQFKHLKVQLEVIKSATNNFADDNCIGRGGFGKVYKGELLLSTGHAIVAFKCLDPRFGQGNPEFWKEVIMLSLYKHGNIVCLLGFCDEGNEKILVYEYASRRSLDLYLNNDDLTWIDRLKICIGAALGLAYLHYPDTTQQRVLHRDIKSSNILLDENWNAKISDFGLSKLGPANQQYTFLVSNTVGTLGYIDPLYIETGLLTKESDVYSFGVVLFEVLCGRLCTSNNNGIHQSLTGLVRRCHKQGKIKEIVFGNIKDQIGPRSLEAFTNVAYQCLKRDFEKRPLMTDVVRILESTLECQVYEQQTSRPGSNVSSSSGWMGNYRTKKIFVGGLRSTSSVDDLRQYFDAYGMVVDVVVMYDPKTSRPRGFGFVTFDTEDAVDRVVQKPFHELQNKLVEVKRALPNHGNATQSGPPGRPPPRRSNLKKAHRTRLIGPDPVVEKTGLHNAETVFYIGEKPGFI